MAIGAARAGFAEVLVNDVHALSGPTQANGTIDQPILQFRALLMLPHLVHGRLSHVDVGQSGAVSRREPFVSGVQRRSARPVSPLGGPELACIRRISIAIAWAIWICASAYSFGQRRGGWAAGRPNVFAET